MAQLFQFIWKTRYLLIWMGILLAGMSLHIQSAEVLRSYWFDNRLSPEHGLWLVIGLVYSGCVLAAAATHIAIHKDTETQRPPRWIITVALVSPVAIVLIAMIAALIAWWDVERIFSTIANGCAVLVAALLLLVLLILWVERPGRGVAFSDRLGAVFSSPKGKLSLDMATGVFILGFLVVPLLPPDRFIGLATTIGSLSALLISVAVLIYAIHRLVTLEGNKPWTRVALVISGVILIALLVNPLVHGSFLVVFAAACLAAVLWELRAAQPSYKAAVSVLLGLFAVLLAIGDIAPTTKVRMLKSGAPTQMPALSTAFEAWLDSRGDINDYKGAPYPVYIVAAQGGGLLAAYHAAMVLSHLQDFCPRFAEHVFAVSGVSGRSLGAAVFASAVDRLPQKKNLSNCQSGEGAEEFQQYSDKVLKRDFLSPLVFMAVIPTIVQRALSLLPDSLLGWVGTENAAVYDRARGLEYGFEAATAGPNFFQRGMRSAWQPDGRAPALLVSMT